MRPFTIDVDPADTDPDGLADNNASSGATLTLDGVLTSGGTFTSADGLGHQISITDTATVDQSGATFTITGTNANDEAISEAVTGPGSGATVESSKYFKTVTSIAIASGAACGTVDCGTDTGGEVASKVYVMDPRAPEGAGVQVVVTGTVNYTVEATMEPISDVSSFDDFSFSAVSAYSGKTADVISNLPAGVSAIRVITASYSSGAEVQAHVAPVNSH